MSLKHPDHLYHIFTYMYTCVIVCKCVPHAQDTYQLKMSIQSMSMIIYENSGLCNIKREGLQLQLKKKQQKCKQIGIFLCELLYI